MNKYNHYEEVKKLSSLMRKNNLSDWAIKIEDAVASGSTGTEIFMALRMRLKEFLETFHSESEITACAKRLYQEIDSALRK